MTVMKVIIRATIRGYNLMTVLVRSDRSSGARIMLLGVENDLQGYGRVLIFFYNSADKQSFLTPIFIRLVTTTTNCFGHLRGVRLIIICARYGNKYQFCV